ncbi:MAG: glycosyltransferase family 2 protein [Fibrobacter sp.]|uniref:glycosyltransferase family 2 protein n=1 Tax=Fibrobacter sp. TaxID=35828 RepID=UPI002A91AC1B|nr:glycosyltransferase family 2 protein [Fibrobacter sp.]MDY6263983.1 glycosyltransferase family 2 protein [Fibrobacter sp.]
MQIDVGIINYNGGLELSECVGSLLAQSVPVRVLVFDNASTDDSIQRLREKNLDCKVIESPKNLGYAGACNGLLENMDSDIQVLCNMDLEFDPTWAENLLRCFERHPEAGSVASLVMEKSGVVNAVGVRFGAGLFAKNEASGLDISEADVREKEVFGCYGAVMSFRKSAAVAAGKMDASFFLFFEETEWYFRHNLAGFKTVFCPEAKVYHERSMTTVRYSPRKLFYSERNRLRTAVRLLPLVDVLKLPFQGVVRYLNMAKGGVPGQSGDGKKLSKVSICVALAKAWLQALAMLPDELVIRKKYRKKFGNVGAKVREILDAYPIENR